MGIALQAGARLRSVTCTTEVVVVKAADDVDLRCGGAAMVPVGTEAAAAGVEAPFDAGTLLGKRYTDAAGTIELLCTKAGDGSLAVGSEPLVPKEAKPLPASD